VEAALFAFKSPLSNGVILADEVGLGKTIEAGLIITQYWSEAKRKIIIIAPASLRKQWQIELKEKFFIDSIVLDSQTYKKLQKEGVPNPFNQKDKVIITSYHYASRMQEELLKNRYDLAVIDEAHKLRNVYKPTNKMANNIKIALHGTKKILLTATPLQNSLLELYGLVSILDDRIFGDKKSFIYQFVSGKLTNTQFKDLKSRIAPICHRTLRQDVLEYVPYTNRIALVQEFYPSEDEQNLYENVSEFLQSSNLHSIPNSQKSLIILIVRKLLSSSTRAIENTLKTMALRLEASLQSSHQEVIDIKDEKELIADYIEESEDDNDIVENPLTPEEIREIQSEISQLQSFRDLAKSIKVDAKLEKLQSALDMGFSKQAELGSDKKALIFTESRRTQEYLKEYLELNGYAGKIVLFNGTNTDSTSKEIYKKWIEKHQGSDKITGSRTADMKQAIVDNFKNQATIMIATEAGSEGINLQFCNLLINYDLPWNPQRIEQRIGRVHRYGQKFDVVVVNFLNKKNEADQRVYELLSEKFSLFDGVFGSSDEVLGMVESGVDFEKAILNVYQSCRSEDDIKNAFDTLQAELDEQIQKTLKSTRKKLLENFDTDVHKRLKGHLETSLKQMDLYEKTFWDLTKIELDKRAEFDDSQASFQLNSQIKDIKLGKYQLLSQETEDNNHYTYRINSPLGEYVLYRALDRELKPSKITFDLTNSKTKISALERFIGKSGYLRISKLTLDGYEKEEYLLNTAITSGGAKIKSEDAQKIITLKALGSISTEIDTAVLEKLTTHEQSNQEKIIQNCKKRNSNFFDTEIEKLDKWADDQIISLEKELKDIKKEIKEKRTESKRVDTTQKLKIQMLIRDLEQKQIKIKRDVEKAEDEIYKKRSEIIDELTQMVEGKVELKELFTIEWNIT
jgi:ERCC4-related helicase